MFLYMTVDERWPAKKWPLTCIATIPDLSTCGMFCLSPFAEPNPPLQEVWPEAQSNHHFLYAESSSPLLTTWNPLSPPSCSDVKRWHNWQPMLVAFLHSIIPAIITCLLSPITHGGAIIRALGKATFINKLWRAVFTVRLPKAFQSPKCNKAFWHSDSEPDYHHLSSLNINVVAA